MQSACLDIDTSRFYKASKVKGHGGCGHFGNSIFICKDLRAIQRLDGMRVILQHRF